MSTKVETKSPEELIETSINMLSQLKNDYINYMQNMAFELDEKYRYKQDINKLVMVINILKKLEKQAAETIHKPTYS